MVPISPVLGQWAIKGTKDDRNFSTDKKDEKTDFFPKEPSERCFSWRVLSPLLSVATNPDVLYFFYWSVNDTLAQLLLGLLRSCGNEQLRGPKVIEICRCMREMKTVLSDVRYLHLWMFWEILIFSCIFLLICQRPISLTSSVINIASSLRIKLSQALPRYNCSQNVTNLKVSYKSVSFFVALPHNLWWKLK